MKLKHKKISGIQFKHKYTSKPNIENNIILLFIKII